MAFLDLGQCTPTALADLENRLRLSPYVAVDAAETASAVLVRNRLTRHTFLVQVPAKYLFPILKTAARGCTWTDLLDTAGAFLSDSAEDLIIDLYRHGVLE